MVDVEVALDELTRRLEALDVRDVERLSGGASSFTYVGAVDDGARQVVVKVAPAGVLPVRNRDVLRQARVLRALRSTAVPVPELLWEDAGEPPDVPPLFVMSFVDGTSLEPLFDRAGSEQDDEEIVAERMRNATRTMAALHALEPEALALTDEPEVGPEHEVDRWCRLLETVDQELVPGWQDVAAELGGGIPVALPGCVVHGDFRLGNMIAADADIRAVVDWEIWSLGDPRVDVGWFLTAANPETYGRSSRYASSVPPLSELTEVYLDAGGRAVSDIGWFEALAHFKSAAVWSLIVKHNRRRAAPDAEIEQMAGVLPHLLERTRTLLRELG